MDLSLSSLLGSTRGCSSLVLVHKCVFVDICIKHWLLCDRWRALCVCVFCVRSVVEWLCHLHLLLDCELCVGCHERLYLVSEVDNATNVLLLCCL